MSISAQIGHNVARIRAEHGISLSVLAERSNLSKATLSELERGVSNPTISTVWALANALAVPFGELVSDAQAQTASLADESASVHLIERRDGPPRGESYLLQLASDGQRVSAPHGRGVREQATALSGRIQAGPITDSVVLTEGDSFDFDANQPHGYFSIGGPASVLVRMEYPDAPPLADDNLHWQPLPCNEEQWDRLQALVDRLLLAVSQSGNAHSLRLAAETGGQSEAPRLRNLLANSMHAAQHLPVQGFVIDGSRKLELIVLPLPTTRIDIGPPPGDKLRHATLNTAVELHALACTASLTPPQAEFLRGLCGNGSSTIRVLSADILSAHGLAADVPARQAAPDVARPWVPVAAACLAGRHLPASPLAAVAVRNRSATAVLPMLTELCPTWRLEFADLETVAADAAAFQALLVFDALQQTDAAMLLQQAARSLTAGGLLLIAEDMGGSFSHPREHVQALVRHHLARMLPPLARLARNGATAADRSPLENALLSSLPAIAADMLHDNVEQAVAGINRLLRDPSLMAESGRAKAFPGAFAAQARLELEALGRALETPEELATHPRRVVQLAEHADLRLVEHRHVYRTDAAHEFDAGTHLFAFVLRGVAPQP